MEPSPIEFIELTGRVRALLGRIGRVATLAFKADLSQRPWRPSFAESRIHYQELARLVSEGLLDENGGQFYLKREHVIARTFDHYIIQLQDLLADPKNAHVVES